jgi:large subunit ribosomal protein L10
VNRTEKKETIAELRETLGTAKNAFVLGFSGLKVPDVTELRQQIRQSESTYLVVKNTLALRAIEGSPLEGLKDRFTGNTAVAYNDHAPVALAKILSNFAKVNGALVFKGAVVEGRAIAAEEIPALAELPTRDEMLARFLFVLQSPVRRLVTVLNGPARNFVSVLSQIAKQKEG